MSESPANAEKDVLVQRAIAARNHGYAPYTRFLVGAALLGRSGKIFTGCNVENVSLGLTMCAERVCVGNAIAEGEIEFDAIAVVAESVEPILPCGACRQVLAEFNRAIVIYSADPTGTLVEYHLDDLLPRPSQGILK